MKCSRGFFSSCLSFYVSFCHFHFEGKKQHAYQSLWKRFGKTPKKNFSRKSRTNRAENKAHEKWNETIITTTSSASSALSIRCFGTHRKWKTNHDRYEHIDTQSLLLFFLYSLDRNIHRHKYIKQTNGPIQLVEMIWRWRLRLRCMKNDAK